MINLFNDPRFQVPVMLWTAFLALDSACLGEALRTFAMIACTCFWMFRIWGGLRNQKQGEEQP